jgi:DNA-binding transcriptional LysR family regulator
MELRLLRYFVAVADCGHITRAAETLGIQQPPLSQQIRALEAKLGVALFRRHARGVTLTDAGRALRADAQRILDSVATMQERMQRMARGLGGVLALGLSSSVAAHAFAPRLLRSCRREFPHISLRLSEGNAAELIEGVADGRLHCGLLRVPVAHPPGVTFEALLTEPAVLALPIDHPLAKAYGRREIVPLKALHRQPLILARRPGSPGLYGNLLALLDRHGVEVNVVAEVERMMSNLNLVASGAGITIVPASMKGAHPRSVVYRPLPAHAALQAPVTIAYRRDDLEGASAMFLALARRIAGAAQAGGALRPAPARNSTVKGARR